MKTLTKKQKQVLEYVERFISEYGHSPSYEEIASGLGLSSPSTVHAHIQNLQRKGYLVKKAYSNRSIDFPHSVGTEPRLIEIPLAGRIAAGSPIEAIHDTMNTICYGNTAAKSAVDLCTYDLMGQIAKQPVCRLLGGKLKPDVMTSKAIGLGKFDEIIGEAI